jgi:CRP-like cAMP-binding protein
MAADLLPNSIARVEKVLRRVRHLENLPEEVIERLARAASARHFKAGQVIYLEGEPAETIYILETGWVKATRMTRDGREQAMMFLRPVEVFGDIAVVTRTSYPGTVVALEDADTWLLPAAAVMGLIEQYPALAMAVIRRLGERVLHYIGMVEDLSLRSVEARLAYQLLQHAETRGEQVVVPRREWTTFDEMAVRLGTVRDVLSRALKSLEAEGLLRVEKQAIYLLDVEELKRRGSL